MKRLLWPLVIICAVLSLMGNVDPSRVGPVEMVGLSKQPGGQQPGAGWEEITIILTPNASMTYPASATHNDSLYTEQFLADIAAADEVYELGTGKDIPEFAWTILKENDTDGFYGSQFIYSTADVRQVIDSVNYLKQNVGNTAAGREVPVFYVPYEDIIPDRSTIVDATNYYSNFNTFYLNFVDTVISVMLDAPGDSAWYENKGGVGVTNSPNYAKASWDFQQDTNGGSWSDVSQGFPWSVDLSAVPYWDLGDCNDWSGSIEDNFFPAYNSGTERPRQIEFDITDCVQSAVNGNVNNGIMSIYQESENTARQALIFGWDAYSSAIGRQPYIKIKYLTKRYVAPYPGNSDAVAVFSTDDFIAADNDSFITVFDRHNMKYTIFGARIHVDAANIYQADMAKILSWRDDDDMEVGTHSWHHKNDVGTEGLPHWQQVAGEITQAVVDSIVADSRPDWLYALADSADGDSRADDLYFGKSIALPNNRYSGEVMNAIVDHDYLTMRTGSMDLYTRDFYYQSVGVFAPARADSSMSGAPSQYGRRARNMLGVAPTVEVKQIVGAKDSVTFDLDSVAHNMRRLVNQIRGQDRGEIVLFWHETKSYGPDWYDEGVDPDELEVICDVLDEYGIPTMRASELGRHRRSGAVEVTTPYGYAANDSLKFSLGDRVWYIPNGVDERHIRGVRTTRAEAAAIDVPEAPTGLDVGTEPTSAYLSWEANTEGDLASYSVYRKIDAGAYALYKDNIPSAWYNDISIAADSATYYYKVTAVDDDSNESGFSGEATSTPTVIPVVSFTGFQLDQPTMSSGNVIVDIADASLNTPAFVRIVHRRHDAAIDTVGAAWTATKSANWNGLYDSGVAESGYNADVGGIDLTWVAGVGQDHYHMQMQPSGGSWSDVDTTIAGGATTYDHDATGSLNPPTRDRMLYRIFGATADDLLSAVAVIDSIFYNQTVGVYTSIHAVKDTDAYYAGTETPVATVEALSVYTSVADTGPDTTPPDTTGVFAGVVVDTTNGSNIKLTLTDMTINEIGQVEFQWSNDVNSGYYGDGVWSEPASSTVGDTIFTTLALDDINPAGAANVEIFTRFRLRDTEGTPNVSGWSLHQSVFTRFDPADDDSVGYGTIATDFSRNVDSDDCYAGKIVMPSTSSVVSGSWYIETLDNDFNIKMGLYGTDDALKASGTALSVGLTGYHVVTFDTPYAATIGEELYLMLSVDETSTTSAIVWFDSEENTPTLIGEYIQLNYGSFPPASLTTPTTYTNRRFSAYVTFE